MLFSAKFQRSRVLARLARRTMQQPLAHMSSSVLSSKRSWWRHQDSRGVTLSSSLGARDLLPIQQKAVDEILAGFGRRPGGVSVVSAPDGVGKTELAKQVCRQSRHSNVVWFHECSDSAALGKQYKKFAIDHRIIDPSEIAKLDLKALVGQVTAFLTDRSDFLVVFDRAGDHRLLSKFIPKNCDVLITTQSGHWPSASILAIDFMNETDALEWMKSILGDRRPHDTEAELLALMKTQLRLCPLAIKQAANFLADNIEMSISEYVEAFNRREERLLGSSSFYKNTPVSAAVWVTFELSIEDLKTRYPEHANQLMLLLQFVSYLAPVSVNLGFLQTCYAKYLETEAGKDFDDEAGLKESIETLITRNVLCRTSDGGVTMSPSTQRLIRVGVSYDESEKLILSSIRAVNEYYLLNIMPKKADNLIPPLLPHAERLAVEESANELGESHGPVGIRYFFSSRKREDQGSIGEFYFCLAGMLKQTGASSGRIDACYQMSGKYLASAYPLSSRDSSEGSVLARSQIEALDQAYRELPRTCSSLSRMPCMRMDAKSVYCFPDFFCRIADAYYYLGDESKFIEFSRYAFAYKIFANPITRAEIECNIARAYGLEGNSEKKREFLELALQTIGKVDAPHCEASVLNKIACSYGDFGDDLNKKKELLQQALRTLRSHHGGKYHVSMNSILENLDHVYGLLTDVAKKQKSHAEREGVVFASYARGGAKETVPGVTDDTEHECEPRC